MIIFINDEGEYISWLKKHPTGFVVNSDKKPSPAGYLMLHRANCGHINSKRGNHTTHKYIKICSRDKMELKDWAQTEIGGKLLVDGNCKP